MSIIREFARFIEPTGELEYDNTTSGLSATTIKSAIDELNTLLGGGNVGSQATFSIYEFAAAGGQTIFDLSGTFTTGGDVTAGNFITNETYKIQTTGTTDFTLIGAADSNPGTVFTATGPGTGTGTARVAVTYIPGYIQVYVNGVFIASTDYTASNGQTVVLTEAAEASDLVTVVVLDSFNTATQLRVINVDASAPDDSLVVDNVGDVSVTSDIKLADNGKAIFGAGSDLQIYHDGFSSYIEESGAGSLLIRGDNLFLTNTAGDQSYFDGIAGGEAILRHNNLPKLTTAATGIDVTGTVTADGLTVDTTSPVIELASGNNNDSRIVFSEAAAEIYSIKVNGTSGSLQDFTIYHDLTSATTARFQIDQKGDISFYEDTGTTAKLVWDASAESLGIGSATANHFSTAGATNILGVKGTTGGLISIAATGTSFSGIDLGTDTTRRGGMYSLNGSHLAFYTNATDSGGTLTERLRIDSAGNVTINSSGTIPTGVLLGRQLVVGSATGSEVIAFREDTAVDVGDIAGAFLIGNSDIDGVEDHFIGMWGKVSSTNGSQDLHFAAGRSGYEGDAPQMTLDSAGNLLVGTTSTSTSTVGHALLGGGADNGIARHVADGIEAMQLGRNTGDGDIVKFYKAGNPVGSIGTEGGDLTIGTGTNCGLQFNDGNAAIRPFNMASNAAVDAAVDLGVSGTRFKDLYLSGGVVLDDNPTAVGGSVTSKTLDDYEEGTWSPVYEPVTGSFASITMDDQECVYVKIGNLVSVSGIIRTDDVDITGGSGALRIAGLPFAATRWSAANIGRITGFAGETPLAGYVGGNSTKVLLYYRTSVDGQTSPSQVTDLTTGASADANYMFFQCTYSIQ